MTLDEIREVDKEPLAARYEAATSGEFGALAQFLGTTTEVISHWYNHIQGAMRRHFSKLREMYT